MEKIQVGKALVGRKELYRGKKYRVGLSIQKRGPKETFLATRLGGEGGLPLWGGATGLPVKK